MSKKNKMNLKRKSKRKHTFFLSGHFYGWTAALLPVVIFLIAYIAMGIFPFGNRAAMIIDSYHQYVPFFAELHDKIWKGDSLLYSWHGSLGFNFLAVQAYYLATPLNLLIALFPSSMMTEAFETMIILKISLASWAGYCYLKNRSGRNSYLEALFGASYALSGFVIAYNWNVMWLDCVALLPFIVMGAERLIDRKDGRLYTLVLGLSIFCNYYISIMICIFLALYFFVVWFSRKRDGISVFLKTGFHFAGCSIMAGGLGAIYLLPTYYTLINSSQGSKPTEFKFYRNVFDMIKQHFSMVEPTQLTGAPNIYCTVLVCLLILFYIVDKKINIREKTARILLTSFMLLSMDQNVLDYIWHGFHFPNNLPGRFSFIYSFMLVIMAYDVVNHLSEISIRLYAGCFVVTAAVFTGCLFFGETMEIYTIIVTGILLALYMLLLTAHKKGIRWKIKKFTCRPYALILFLLTVELAANSIFGLCMNGSINRDNYTGDRKEVAEIRKEYEAKNTFYRMELNEIRGRDDVVWHHLNGLSFFSSTADDRLEKLTGALGFYNSGNKYSYKGATPLTDAMMSIRYVISEADLSAANFELADEKETKKIYENKQWLPVGFMVNPTLEDWRVEEGHPFSLQNDFIRLSTGITEPLFEKLDTGEPELTDAVISSTEQDKWFYKEASSSGSLTWQLYFDDPQDVYLYFEASHCKKLEVIVEGKTTSYSDQRGHIVHLGMCDAGKVVTLNFPVDDEFTSGNVKLQLVAMNTEVWEKTYNTLSENGLDVTSFDSRHLNGTIKAEQDGLMLLSIPYDTGWNILVDGQKAEQEPVGEALTGVRLSAGTHQIVMKYTPQGMRAGLAISLISLCFYVFYCRKIVSSFKRKRK